MLCAQQQEAICTSLLKYFLRTVEISTELVRSLEQLCFPARDLSCADLRQRKGQKSAPSPCSPAEPTAASVAGPCRAENQLVPPGHQLLL